MNLQEELEAINETVALRLWALADEKRIAPRLVIPRTRNGFLRVSEQEARFLLCRVLDDSRWFYSVETPTREVFQETGLSYLSARTDVSLYDGCLPSEQSKKVNIELKANNPPVEQFRKDFEKLAREGLDGVWFHLLKHSDAGTMPSIFGKIRESFRAVNQYLEGKQRFILFAFCVLAGTNQRLVQNVLQIGNPAHPALDEVERLFGPNALLDKSKGG